MFKQPLLGGRGGVADVHEDPVVAFAAIHATAADGVVQALVLQNTEVIGEAALGMRANSSSRNSNGLRGSDRPVARTCVAFLLSAQRGTARLPRVCLSRAHWAVGTSEAGHFWAGALTTDRL